MTTDSPVSTGTPLPNSDSKRRLAVPVGGHGFWWSVWTRYSLIFSLHFFLAFLPFRTLASWYYRVDGAGRGWFVQHLMPSADSDVSQRTFQYLMPLVVALIWMAIDRKRRHEPLISWLARLVARYGMAAVLGSYGLEKIFGGQGWGTYVHPRGMLPPFGNHTRGYTLFLWLGHGQVYDTFAALVELAPIFLLPFRRTATLGAIIALAALVNVFVVNTGHWNIGFSLTPVAMAAMPPFILAPHLARLWRLFRGEDAAPVKVDYLTPPSWWWPTAAVTKAFMVVWMLYASNHFVFSAEVYYWKSALRGIYRVESFTKNGEVEPWARERPGRWSEVAIGGHGEEVTIVTVGGVIQHHYVAIPNAGTETNSRWANLTSAKSGEMRLQPPERKGIGLSRIQQPADSGLLRFTHAVPGTVTLAGVIGRDTITAELRLMEVDTLPFLRYRTTPGAWRASIARWFRSHGFVYPY